MSLSQVVEKELNRSPFILEAMEAGIVNISSLARYINDDVNKKMGQNISPAAIGMTIKRLPFSENLLLDKSISRFMEKLGDITVRSDLADFTFRNSAELLQCQVEFLQLIEEEPNYFYSFCKGVYETTVICSETMSLQIDTIFQKEEMINKRVGLAAVSILLPPTNLDTYGVYYTILKKLAWKGINIVEVLSTSYEISLIINKEDIEEVFSIIIALKKSA